MDTLEETKIKCNNSYKQMALFIKTQCSQTGKTTDEFWELMRKHEASSGASDKIILKLREEISKLDESSK